MCFFGYLYKIIYLVFLLFFIWGGLLYQSFNRCSYSIELLPRSRFRDSWAIDPSRAWDSVIPVRWTSPARGIRRFLGDGPFLRVRFSDSRAVDPSSAWDSVIPVRWTSPARGILRFLGAGRLPRVGFCNFWAVDLSSARDSAILGRWTAPARAIRRFLSGGTFQRLKISFFQA